MNRFHFPPIVLICFLAAILSAVSVSGDEATDRFNAAKQAFDNGRFEESRVGFADFLARHATHAQANEAKFYLAESYLNLRQYDTATGYYNQLVGLGTSNPYARVAMFRLGDIPYIQEQFDVAKPRLEDFVDKLPNDTNLQFVLYYLGDIAMRKNSPLEAEHYFGQSVRMFPQGARYVESQLGLAWAKNSLNNFTAADEIYRQLLNSSDSTVLELATYQWGVAQFERNEIQLATTTLTNFLTRWPRSSHYADAQRVLARCKGALGDYNGALQIISQISQPTIDDILMKIRCLYGLGQIQEARSLLTGIERTAGSAYMDEITLFKSVFLFDEKNWAGTIGTLEQLLLPQYNPTTGKMSFNYSIMPTPVGGHKLNDDMFLKACAILALAYAQNGEAAKADATITEMNGSAMLSGNSDLIKIVSDTSSRLSEIYAQNTRPGGNPSGSGGGQWTPGTGNMGIGGSGTGQWNPSGSNSGGNSLNSGNGRPGRPGGTQNPGQNSGWNSGSGIASGTDLEQFWQASQLYDRKNWAESAQILDRLLMTQYNPWSRQFYINYTVTGTEGTLNEATLAKACSMLVLARAQAGDYDQAGAALTAFAGRIQPTDSVQQNLYRETQSQLSEWARTGSITPGASGNGSSGGSGGTGNGPSLISESEQRQILRTCNSLYNAKRFDQVDARIRELLEKRPVDSVKSEAMLLRSKALLELGREHEAVSLLETIIADFPSAPQYKDALWFLGLYYETCGDSYKSVEYFQLLKDNFPNYKDIDGVMYFLALEDLENGNGRKAGTYLTQVYKNHQNGKYWSHVAWTLAFEAYKKKEYSQAEAYVQKVLQNPPDIAILDRALYLKGELSMRKKEYEKAYVAFREVGRLCPDSPLRNDADRNMQVAARNVNTVR